MKQGTCFGEAGLEVGIFGDGRHLRLLVGGDFSGSPGLDGLDLVLQVEETEFLDFHPDRLQRGEVVVAGLEVARARAEEADGGLAHALHHLDHLHEVRDFGGTFLGGDDRQFRNVDAVLDVALADRHGGGKQAAERVATLLDQVDRALLGRGDQEHGTREGLHEGGILDLRREVAEEQHGGIAAGGDELLRGVSGVLVSLDDRAFTFRHGQRDAGRLSGSNQLFRALCGERAGEAIAGCGNEAELDLGRVLAKGQVHDGDG